VFMRKPYSNPGGDARERLFSGSHLTDHALLLSLDGELSSREVADVDVHVQSCWSCRGRRQAIGQSIADLVDYQNAVTAPYLPPPVDQRAIFLARLDALAIEMGRPSRLRNFLNGAIRILRLNQMNQFVWTAGALALMVSVPIVYFLQTPPVVSADELLNLTAASEVRSLKTAAEPVVVQKLRISMGKKTLTRTVYRDIAHNRTTSRTDGSDIGEAQVRAAYSKTSLDWDSQLDANSYRHWRAGRPANTDKVVRLGTDELRLETTPSTGPVAEADLTVRLADYHAVSENFHLQDHSEIEIAELSYDVIPFASLPPGIFGVPAQIAMPRLSIAATMHSVLPSAAELAEAEVKTDSVLHGLGADLGEQINITTHAGREVMVEGVVGDDVRKHELVSALQKVPFTRLHLLTIDEAAQRALSSPVADPASSVSAGPVMVASPPLLEVQLGARFPDKDQRIAYVNQTLSLAQLASARAWALNRLADRYPAQRIAVLNDDARQQVQMLLTDHVSALREDISSLQNQLGEILSRTSNTPAANTSLTAPLQSNSASAPEFSEDWRTRVRRAHSSTEAVHEAIAALLTSSPSSDHNDAEAIEVNLRTSLTQLRTDLQLLGQDIQKPNLK
jgi:hypothetical protein